MPVSQFVSPMLTSGGDRRITVRPGSNTNIYGASPFPRSTLGYASSTANDISLDAFRHLEQMIGAWAQGRLQDGDNYRRALESMRARIRSVWDLPDDTDIVFAPSGTDLEFVALDIAARRSGRAVTNILLGQDEVGSGCVLSAAGRYFASETPLCAAVQKGQPVAGLEGTDVTDIPVRDVSGAPRASSAIVRDIETCVSEVVRAGRHALAHAVHGSKTGLVLPSLEGIDALRRRHGDALTIVVDACQARIEARDLLAYLERDCIVLLTGSKFMGGPPFSGSALVPAGLRPDRALSEGLATVFRRAEWPLGWPGSEILPDTANPGLLLRLEAALFELERFCGISKAARGRVIGEFGRAVRMLAERLGVGLVAPSLAGDALHQSTLATLDLSGLPCRPDFATAQRWHRVLAARGLRLGQPVKCVPDASHGWAGTLRISLSMPLISILADLEQSELASRFARDMARIADVLEAAQRPVVA